MKSEDPEVRREKDAVKRQIIQNRSQKSPSNDGYAKKAALKYDLAKNGKTPSPKNCETVEWGYLNELGIDI